MPTTFDARIRHYRAMLENLEQIRAIEKPSRFHDLDLSVSERIFREHLEALEFGKAFFAGDETDIEARLQTELERAKKYVRIVEVLISLVDREENAITSSVPSLPPAPEAAQ